jgi:uncharacterized protein (DUF1778 family)
MDNTQTGQQTYGGPALPQRQVPEPTCSVRLSERDESQVMATSEQPPAPNEAAVQAARRFTQRHE